MRKRLLAGFCMVGVAVCFLVAVCDVMAISGDGSRAVPVHVVPLVAEPFSPGEQGAKISPEDETAMPFSMRSTCCECHVQRHDYGMISGGWHFNAVDPNVPPGRPGQPWILADPTIATQIPLSYRGWKGTFRPEQVGLSAFEFTHRFARHLPGGGSGDIDSTDPDEIARQIVSGKLEVNCLACHDGHPGHDQAEYATQVAKQNFRWAATASSSFASVSGSAKAMPDTYDHTMPEMLDDPKQIAQRPTVTYHEATFGEKDQVFFDVVKEVPAERCYFCHSNLHVGDGGEPWHQDEDIHLTAGMTCVDCHREGLEHNTIRGYEGEQTDNALAAHTTCAGCHLGEKGKRPEGGRLGAPKPKHAGIPPVHFEKLSCTACHSGPWPSEATTRVKTSVAHGLGTHGVNKSPQVLPHVIYPVFARQEDGKIAPHKMIWPAFWAVLDGDVVTPVDLETVHKAVGPVLAENKAASPGDWQPLDPNGLRLALAELQKVVEGTPVYVAGGVLYQLSESGSLSENEDHPAAEPYLWPIGHDVRPAAQSLGIRKCKDCHTTDAPFFFGAVAVDSPVVSEPAAKTQVDFQQISPAYAWAFAWSFTFRPWFKVFALGASALIGLVLLCYGLRALGAVARVLAEQE